MDNPEILAENTEGAIKNGQFKETGKNDRCGQFSIL